MATRRHLVLLWLALAAGGRCLAAASAAESRDFAAAAESFRLEVWDRAESELSQFLVKYPASEHVPEAVLLQAQAQFRQRKFSQAIALLTGRKSQADKLADQFLFWLGEIQFQSTNFAAAAESFGKLAATFPTSGRRLEASVKEAAARARLGEWPRVAELLRKPDGAFQQSSQAAPDTELAARGLLLLAEAELAQQHPAEAESALQPLAGKTLPLELDWQRQFLLGRAWLGANRKEEALAASTNLLSLAARSARPELMAESVAFHAGILEQLNRPAEAMAAFRLNLTNAPVERQRQALAKIAELALAQNQLAEAASTLEKFLAQFPDSAHADLALLTLGEVRLKQFQALDASSQAGDTNLLQQALGSFDRLISSFTNSALLGKAQLGRGWCYWSWPVRRVAESLEAFKTAAALLPPSEDLAIARFKLGDAQFAQKDFAGALANYRSALAMAADWPRAKESLTTPALYQIVQAALELKDLPGATNALEQLLTGFPQRAEAPRSLLLVGQELTGLNRTEEARATFAKFVELYPLDPLRPKVELAMARTYEQAGDWAAALTDYDGWLERFGTNDLRPRAEFHRALASFQAGNETNALTLFTNFVTRFPTHELAPLAQWWVADYHYRLREFLPAETGYKLLFQTWPQSELAAEACMMAGRAAVGWLNYPGAIDYFTNLTSGRLDCSPTLKLQALFAYGSALVGLASTETNKQPHLELAIGVFNEICRSAPTNELCARAWGEIGNCHLQLATQDEQNYTSATNAYQQALTSPYAGAAVRSQAQVALAQTFERLAERQTGDARLAQLKVARDHYLDVFLEKNLREGEQADLFWVKKAGLEAARLLESEPLQEWDQAINLYRRLQTLLPPLQASLEARIAKAQERLPPEKK